MAPFGKIGIGLFRRGDAFKLPTPSEAGRALGAQARADHRARVAANLDKLKVENQRTDIARLGWPA